MKFSVITPSYNQAQFIEATIQSALQQDYANFEHIVMDGGSRDGTLEVLRKYPHLIWRSEKDSGQTHALNKAHALASGNIICWINADDLLCSGAFRNVAAFFVAHPDKHIVVGNLLTIDAKDNVLQRAKAQKLTYEGLLNGGQSVQQPSTFFRKEVFDIIGLFDESYNYCMDHELFLRAAQKFEFHTIDCDLAMFRRYPGTKTTGNELNFIHDLRRLRRDYHGRLLSKSNRILMYSYLSAPFKQIDPFRRAVRRLKGKDPDFHTSA